MVQATAGWELAVERGPDWLFVRPLGCANEDDDMSPLAEQIWTLLQQNMLRRVVVELDNIGLMRSRLVGQLVWLQKRVHNQGGLMRLCGLSEHNQLVLQMCRLDNHLPQYRNREDAVMGYRPVQPR